MMRKLLVALVLIGWMAATVAADDPKLAQDPKGVSAKEKSAPLREKVKGANEEFDQLLKEFKQADDKYVKLISEVRPTLKSREERQRLVVENDPSLKFATRAFELARQNPKTIVGVLSLRFVCACGYTSLNKELIALKNVAVKHLEENYIDEEWFWAFLPTIAIETRFCDVKPFLRRCLNNSAHRVVRGQACIHLAGGSLQTQRFLNQSGEALPAEEEREMVALYERCIKEFGDLPTADTTIAIAAERNLFEIRNLVVGKPAPKTVGKDIDGAALDLDDYRGKVVMLSFWGDWCVPCRQMLRGEQSLAENFKDRPFILLGINSDPQAKAKKAIEREKLTWRSWWDGGNSSGPIAATWNVNAWPTIYILDHEGIIRFRYYSRISEAELEKNIDQLLLERPQP